jgi:hypothetical protein
MSCKTPLALFALAALAARIVLSPAAAMPPGHAAAAVPSALDPGPQEKLVATLAATGVQIYACRAEPGDAAAPFRWVFVAPEARLLDARGNIVGRHGAGPHWLADDGSRIDGTLKARADAPVPGTIAWLLLTTSASGTSPGRFAGVTSVQRVNTSGGAAPTAPCDARSAGRQVRVPYTADYRLFRPLAAQAAAPVAGEPLPGTRGVVYLPAQFEAAAHAAQAGSPVPTF